MSPRITDTRAAQNEVLHKIEGRTAAGAWRIVITFAEDFCDTVTLMYILGVEKGGLSFKEVHEEYEKENAPKTVERIRRSTKKIAKESTKRSAKKFTRKMAERTVEKAAKRTTKKAAKETTRKATNQQGHATWV